MNQILSDNPVMNADQAPSNPSRRRLARGGLAAPVVLASVVSRNAFAATPYNCTVSGKLSGNTSPFGPNSDPNASCSLRAGRSELVSTLKNNQTTFASAGFATPFFANGNNNQGSTLASQPFQKPDKSRDASMFQVLSLNSYAQGSAAPKDPEFAKMAVVLYQNATQGPSDLYPLTRAQVVAMFNAAMGNQEYRGSTSMGAYTWTPDDVRKYFQQLYH